jgi:hypothetical protein
MKGLPTGERAKIAAQDKASRASFMKQLNKLGAQGWELVQIDREVIPGPVMESVRVNDYVTLTAYLKRRTK